MELYLKSVGILSAAGNNSDENFLKNPPVFETDMLLCKEPDYSAYIPAMQLRRMSKAVRMGIGASKIALQKAGIEKPDALSAGTALGCLQDTEVFLSKMLEQQEQMLTPTAFIQSTHNTVGGQIALVNGCNGHNLTYVHRGHSFEHAMMNAQLYLNDHKSENILVGGIDELTPTAHSILQGFGLNRNAEGATFFVVSDEPANEKSVCVKDIYTFTTKDKEEVLQEVNDFLKRNKLGVDDIGLVLLGGAENDVYNSLQQEIFTNNSQATFKNICGEYPTASAFGLAMAIEKMKADKLKNVVMVNNYGDCWGCWWVRR